MIRYALIALVIVNSVRLANATELSHTYVNSIVNAIYKAEGGSKTRYPFGIHWETNYAKARVKCEATVRNNHHRWQASSSKEDFITFLSRRYVGETSGRVHWVKNVNYFLRVENGRRTVKRQITNNKTK